VDAPFIVLGGPGFWLHDYIGEATMFDAILDRLLHGSHRLELLGESMRKLNADKATHESASLIQRDLSE